MEGKNFHFMIEGAMIKVKNENEWRKRKRRIHQLRCKAEKEKPFCHRWNRTLDPKSQPSAVPMETLDFWVSVQVRAAWDITRPRTTQSHTTRYFEERDLFDEVHQAMFHRPIGESIRHNGRRLTRCLRSTLALPSKRSLCSRILIQKDDH